ncbi:MAG: two-component system sensor histidine kinase NtrB [Exilispira sp.]
MAEKIFNFNSEALRLLFLYFDQTEEIVFIFKIKDNTDELVYANQVFYNLLNYSKDDISKIKFDNIFDKISIKEKNKIFQKLNKSKYIILSTSIANKNNILLPVSAKFYLYENNNEKIIIIIASNQLEKNIYEYRKHLSEVLLNIFQKYKIEEDLISKAAESIFIYFDSNVLIYFPLEIKDKPVLYYMDESALVKTYDEEIIKDFKKLIDDNYYLLKTNKEPLFICKIKKNTRKIKNEKIGKICFDSYKFTYILIPIYIGEILQSIIIIGSLRDQFFREEINLIHFTFQGLLLFKMKEQFLLELKYQQKIFSDLLEYSLEMHYREYLPERKLEYISSACKQITGFDKEELMNNPSLFWERIHQEDREKLIKSYLPYSQKEKDSQKFYEYRFIHKDGSIRWFSDLFEIIKDEFNKPQYIVGSIRDITKQKENEQYLIQMQNQIAQIQKMEALCRFSSEISHDFNNIISSLKGIIQISLDNIENIKRSYTVYLVDIKEKKLKKEDSNFYKTLNKNIEDINQNLIDCLDIIKKGLELTERIKLFYQKKNPETLIFEVNDQISSLKAIFKTSTKKDIEIIYNLPSEKFYIKMNKSQFDQVLLNLLVNAYDSIEKKGKIIIKTEFVNNDENNKKNSVPLDARKKYVKITVKDTGCGMDKNVLMKIFEPFFTTKGQNGSGLGLSIVYNIIKQNDGFIDVKSEKGFGTSFFIYLPLVD